MTKWDTMSEEVCVDYYNTVNNAEMSTVIRMKTMQDCFTQKGTVSDSEPELSQVTEIMFMKVCEEHGKEVTSNQQGPIIMAAAAALLQAGF